MIQLMKIFSYLKSIWQNKSLRNFLVLVIITLLFLRQCNKISNLKQDLVQTENITNRSFNNYKAAQDSVRVLKLDNGNMVSTIKSYEFDIANLEEGQKDLIKRYSKALGLNKDLSKINTMLAAEIKIKDSILADLSVTKIDSLTDLVKFNKFDDFGSGNTRLLKGSMFVYRDVNNILYRDPVFAIKQEISLFAAIENIEGQDEIKISTKYPGLTITDIENISLINTKLNQRNEKTAGWSVGFGVGYGVNLNNNQVISYGPSLGVGLFYSPKWLRF